nr:putative transposase [Saccharum officinarum]
MACRVVGLLLQFACLALCLQDRHDALCSSAELSSLHGEMGGECSTPAAAQSPEESSRGPGPCAPPLSPPLAKRKGKGPPNPAPAAEAPVAKKPKTGDACTPAAEPPRSGVAVAHTAVQTLASASSAALAMLYRLPAPMSTLPVLHDADADGQTRQQEEGRINDGGWQTVVSTTRRLIGDLPFDHLFWNKVNQALQASNGKEGLSCGDEVTNDETNSVSVGCVAKVTITQPVEVTVTQPAEVTSTQPTDVTGMQSAEWSYSFRHLEICEPRLKMHDFVDKLQSSVTTESSILTNWRFDPKLTRCKLVRLIVLHELPFSFVEYDGFRSYSASLNPLAETHLDNAAPNNTMMDILKANLLKVDMLHCDDGLQAIDGVINNIRESVKYVRASQSRKEKFEDVIVELGIRCWSVPKIDVENRWNSTCDMIESAMPFKEAFLELKVKDSKYTYCPSSQDWERANAVCKLLKVFKKATEVVPGTSYPTSNLYFHEIWSIKQVLEEEAFSPNEIIVAMVSKMQEKIDKYWMILYFTNCVPVILDPRFKFGFIEFRLKQEFGEHGSVPHLDKLDQTIRRLFNAYSTQMGGSSQVETHGDDMTVVGKGHSWSDWSEHTSAKRKEENSEYDRLVENARIEYPTLAAIARDMLDVTASTVPSESAFSTSGRIINDHRTRLAGSTGVVAGLLVQNALKYLLNFGQVSPYLVIT